MRNIGGLIGHLYSTQTSTITNSSNEKEGNINGGNRVGGLTGESLAGLIVNNCYNLAKLTTSESWPSSGVAMGGLVTVNSGWGPNHEDIVILNSYNKGNLEPKTFSNIGGLLSSQSSKTVEVNTKIINSYNQGNITSSGTLNGIMKIQPKSITFNNIYNSGLLNNTNINDNYIIGKKETNAIENYKNVYYLNSIKGTKPEDTTNVIGKSESEMKNVTFVNTLNTNKNSIDLTEIDSRLSGYTLCDWKLGVSGYPELDCK